MHGSRHLIAGNEAVPLLKAVRFKMFPFRFIFKLKVVFMK
jgi:hypothetical protein